MMFPMTVLDLLETMVERLVANRRAGLARLEAFAMQLVVMMGMLRSGFGWPQGHAGKSRPDHANDLTSVHDRISLYEHSIAQETRFSEIPGLSWGGSRNEMIWRQRSQFFSRLSRRRPK